MRTKLYFLLWICFSVLFVSCGDNDGEPDSAAVTGIELSKSELSLKEGKNETLIAVVAPDNAANKKVTWKSSNESVATVDANGKVTALKAGRTTITVITEDGGKEAVCKVTVQSSASVKGGRTVLAYLAADNSLSAFALEDLAEMKEGMALIGDNNANLLVYIDVKGSSPRLIELKNESGTVTETVVKTYGSRNSVGVAETQEVFADVFSNSKYQAESYGLVYWSHGDGWLPYPLNAGTRWVGEDISNGFHRMNISEFVEILATAPSFDFILFDACFMQSVEVAYELRDYTNYCIGSPTEIPGPGASYDEVVPAMFSAGNVAFNIAEAYYEPYAAKYTGKIPSNNDNWTGGVSVCALKTDQLDRLAQVTKQILPETVDRTQLRSSIFYYDKRNYVSYYDLVGMIREITDDTAYATWKQAFDDAVVSWDTTPMNYSGIAYIMFSMENTNGVSCYIPTTSDNLTDQAYRSTEWYTAAGFGELNW
ncbi:MAG: hypothetical protein EGQ20_18320 [Bacteroides oleiciplenus]|nr:hypothetical protein [Bacteroides oleiciplenus]